MTDILTILSTFKSCIRVLNYQQLSPLQHAIINVEDQNYFIYFKAFSTYSHAHKSKQIPKTIMYYIMILKLVTDTK